MLEERVYDEKELEKILKTQGQKNIKEKLKRYDIDFSVSRSDNSHIFEIHKINDKFKAFCILDLDFSANTDFSMLKHFIYYFYNNDEFRILSQNLMCQILEKDLGKAPCRQTIGKWLAQLEKQDLYFKDISEYKYFSVYNGNFREIPREEYCKAWKAYFDYLEGCPDKEDSNSYYAFKEMFAIIGGKAVKRPNYYLLAFEERSQKMKTYRVDRMEDVKLMGEMREGAEAYKAIDIETYSQRTFSMFGGKTENVTIRFRSHLLDTVVDKFGKKNVIYLKQDDEHFTVTTKVNVSGQFFSWLCGFGKMAKLISPVSVVDEFKNYIDNIRSSYE